MKTKFFKKLSFVLVVAMVLSLLVPAAGVFAATKPELNSTNKYLHLGRDDANEFNFNINNKQKGWQYYWESADEDVVVVNEANGVVTAVGVGKTVVSVDITDADDNEVDTLVAAVTVRDNIAEVTIKNPVEGTLGVNVEHDFNRSFVTESGSKKKTDSITRWEVDSEDASIDDKGVFVATKAGEYKVTARSFQSKARYNAWVDDAVKYADYVLATDETTVTVAPSMTGVEQLDKISAKVTFDSDMSKAVNKDNLKVVSLIGTARVNQLVKEIKFNAAGTEATVTMYVDFTSEGNYLVIFGEQEEPLKAAKIDASEVVKVELAFNTMVYTDAPKALSAKLYNAADVDITTDTLLGQVTYELDKDSKGYLVGKDLYLFNKDEVAVVTATFHTYKYNPDTYEEITVKGIGQILAVEAAVYGLGSNTEWTFGKGTPDWDNTVTSLAAGDTGYSVFARAKKTDDAGTYVNSNDAGSLFTFSSSDSSVLVVDTYGTVYPAKAGNAVIVCYYDGVAREAFNVLVSGERKVNQFSSKDNKLVINITNSTNVAATDEFELVIKDQLQADWPDADVSFTIESLQGNPAGLGPITSTAISGTKKIAVAGSSAVDGTWRYLVKGHDKQIMLTVNVQKPTADGLAAVKVWKLSLDKYTVDTAVANKDAVKSVTPELIGYASNGIACYKADLTATGWSYKVNDDVQAGASFAVTSLGTSDSTPIKDASGPAITVISGTSITKIDKGAYVVNAYEGTTLRGTARFTVTDSTPVASAALENATTTKRDILEAVRDTFKVTFNGDEVADENLYEVTYVLEGVEHTDLTNALDAPAGNLFVKSVKFMKNYDQTTDGDKLIVVEHTVNIGRTIVIK